MLWVKILDGCLIGSALGGEGVLDKLEFVYEVGDIL